MKRILFSGVLLLLFCTVALEMSAQDKKLTRKEREAAWRAERLRKRAAEDRIEQHNDSILYLQTIAAIKSGSWALEASNITFDNGVTNFVTESTNFVSVNEGTGTVQTALNNSNVYSPNGLGGLTLEGRVDDENLHIDRYGNIYYSFSIFGSEISTTVNITVTAGSNQATAFITPNFSNRNLTMSGYIFPYANAGIIEGTTGY